MVSVRAAPGAQSSLVRENTLLLECWLVLLESESSNYVVAQ